MSQPAINYQSHLFFIEPSKNKYLPPWFLESVTRAEAEKTLNESTDNVLMRRHSSFDSTGKYVITHRKETASFRHYLLLNTPDGFLLDIDHKNNHPVNCLSEAMNLFVKFVGRAAKPISSGLSTDYLKPNNRSALENTKTTKANENAYIDHGSSTGPLQTFHDYVNTPHDYVNEPHDYVNAPHDYVNKPHDYVNTPQVLGVGELNRNVPPSPEKSSSVPFHNYLNTPQLSAASSKPKLWNEAAIPQDNTRDAHNYVNVQQLSPTEDAHSKAPGFGSQPLTYDDFPPDFPPPPPL